MKKQMRIHLVLAVLLFIMLPVLFALPDTVYAETEGKASLRSFDEDGNWQPDTWWDDYLDYDTYVEPQLSAASLNMIAKGNTYTLKVSDAESSVFTVASGGNSVIRLTNAENDSVVINPLAAGTAEVTVTAVTVYDKTYTLTCRVTVSEPAFASSTVEILMNKKTRTDINILGLALNEAYYSDNETIRDNLRDAMTYDAGCSVKVGKSSVASAYLYDGKLHIQAIARGSTRIRVSIYGRDLLIQVKVYRYTLNKYTVNTYKDSTAKRTLRVIGAGNAKVTWTSSNPNIVKISKSGTAVTKGIGTAKITAQVNGVNLHCIYSVSSKKAYQAVKMAREISQKKNIQYSQAKRMSGNYYDCSSLVWRCYRPYGIWFGQYSTWAPTAAAEGKWCVDTNRVVARGSVEILSRKLLPGDTIFYSYSGDNGRYLWISHTAIFAGYEYDEYNGYYGTVIEASSSQNDVIERAYYPSSSIVLIGRPTR